MRLWVRMFHAITAKDYVWTPNVGRRPPEWHEQSTDRFIDRFEGRLDVRGKTILDVGAGSGDMVAMLARDGAAQVVGVDLGFAQNMIDELRERYGEEAASKIQLIATTGDMHEVGDQRFDMVISKEAMEHYEDPEGFLPLVVDLLKPGGELVIGFGPLWKSFDGGHVSYMTRVPWAHLIFPEDVIMAERRRFRPEENATHFGEIRGGLNKMTLARFERIMAATGLEPVFLKHNAGGHPAVRAMDKLARFRPLREYFTNNVYGIWRKPARASR